jgi:hypothetical protein
MDKNNKEKFLKEHLKKIKFRVNYNISETPKYRPVIEDDMEFDEIPDSNYMTQDGQPVPNVGGTDAFLEEQGDESDENNDDKIPAPEGPKEPAEPSNARAPESDDVPDEEPEGEVIDEPIKPENTGEEIPEEEPIESEEGVDQIQNDIIKHNIEAMKSIQSKLEDLENIESKLSSQLSTLDAKVKEVEEPTDAEKMMEKKDVSYPYYFNLNDFWKGNWFDQQRQESQEKGIKQLPDGTYIADFDDLPTHNDMEIEDSFNSIV